MASFHRIVWFHNQIEQGTYPNATKLSHAFEISSRQAQRDIEYLKDSLNAPLVYSYQQKGYYYDQQFVLPTFYLSMEEKAKLRQLSSQYLSLSEDRDDTFGQYAELFSRLTGETNITLPKRTIVPYTAEVKILDGQYKPSQLDYMLTGTKENHVYIYEFYNPEKFIYGLLGSGMNFQIRKPNWLIQRVRKTLNQILENQKNSMDKKIES